MAKGTQHTRVKRVKHTHTSKEDNTMAVVNSVPALNIPVKVVLPHVKTTDEGQQYYTFSWHDFYDVEGHKPPARRMLCNLGNPMWTSNMLFVHIARDNGDVRMPEDVYASAMIFAQYHAKKTLGVEVVFHATQAGYKGGSYVVVSLEAHNHLAKRFDPETAGCTFANYLPLLYSELAGGPIHTMPAVWTKDEHGTDGNSPADPIIPDGQYRYTVFDSEGWPKLAGKGTVKGLDRLSGDPRVIHLTESCIKWHSGVEEGDTIIGVATPLSPKPGKSPTTWEFAQLWKVNEITLEFFRRKIDEEIRKLMDPIKEARKGNRVPLLRSLGGLKIDEGVLSKADRNVISAVRSNMPWCKELEDRLGRIMIRIIAERIIPSGGLFARSYLAYQHDVVGVKNVDLDSKKVKCIAFRLPLTSMANIAAFDRKLRKGVLHSNVLVIMAGDSDGDRILVLSEDEAVQLFQEHHIDFEAGLKPAKTPRLEPLTPEFLFSHAIACHKDGGMIGILTMAQHKLMTHGYKELATIAGQAGQAEPMKGKHNPTLNGKPIEVYAAQALRVANSLPKPQWRIMQERAKECKSPREMGALVIDEPECMIDHCWNFGAETMRAWHLENPLTNANLVEMAKLVMERHGEFVVTNTESRWLQVLKTRWGTWWSDWHAEAAQGIYTPVGEFIKSLESIGMEATERKLFALLKWTPVNEDSDDFMLKWYVVGKLWEWLFGFHPSVIHHFQTIGCRVEWHGNEPHVVKIEK
jgi:hypothetical protein